MTATRHPLTDTDVRMAVAYALSGWYGEWLLAGGARAHQIRTSDGACGGWPTDRISVSVDFSRRGLLIRISEHPEGRAAAMRPGPPPPPAAVRVGRISWHTAETILRELHEPPGQTALFDLEVA